MHSTLSLSFGRLARRRKLVRIAAIATMALMAIAPLDAAAASTPFGVNLVTNPGAQNGTTHWEVFPSFATHKYGSSGFGFPSKATGQAIGGGTRFFYPGPWNTTFNECGDANQQWSLKGMGAAIDSGHVKVTLKGYAGTNGAADINAHLDLYFRDSQNHPVSSNGIEKVATSTNEHYKLLKGSAILPKHTRILRIHMFADGGDAEVGGCQGFFDNLSVTLKSV